MSIQKIVSLLFGLFLASIPLIYFSFLQNGYEFPKFVIFVTGSICFFVFLSFYALKRSTNFLFRKEHVLLLVLTGILFFSDVTGVDPYFSLLGSSYRYQGFITFLCGVVLFMFTSFWFRLFSNEKKYVFLMLICSGVIISAISAYQFILLNYFNYSAFPRFDDRIIATFGNPNFMGGYLAVLFSFVYFQNSKFSSVKLGINKRLKNIILGLFVIAITVSYSRSALICIPIVILIPFLFSQVKNVRLIIGVSILAVLFFSSILFIRSSVYDTRLLIWTEGVKAVVNSPIFGYGQENFEIIFPLDLYMKVDSAHNIFLEFAVAGGFLSLGLFIWFLYLILKKAPFDIRIMLFVFLITASFNPISITQWSLFWVIAGFSASRE